MPLNLLQKLSSKAPISSSSSSSSSKPKTAAAAALNFSIFPPPEKTYQFICWLLSSHRHPALRHAHPQVLEQIQPADVQQYLTETLGFKDAIHWTWIGCTFASADVREYINITFDDTDEVNNINNRSNNGSKLPHSQRKALYEFCRKTEADELARRYRTLDALKGGEAREAWSRAEKARKEREVRDLEHIMMHRMETKPTGTFHCYATQGGAYGWFQ